MAGDATWENDEIICKCEHFSNLKAQFIDGKLKMWMAQRLRDYDFCNGWVFYGIECSWQEGAGPEPGTHNLTSTHQQKG